MARKRTKLELQRRVRRIAERLDRAQHALDAALKYFQRYLDGTLDVGSLGQKLGVKATTPCAEVQDAEQRRTIRKAIVAAMLPPRPGRAYVCHRCDNPKCVKAEHLFWGTHSDNMRDAVLKGRRGHEPGVESVGQRYAVLAVRAARRVIELKTMVESILSIDGTDGP